MAQRVLTLNDGQLRIVANAKTAADAANNQLQLVLATICAGEGIDAAKVISVEGNALTLEISDE